MQSPTVGSVAEEMSPLVMYGYRSDEASRARPWPITVKLAGCCAEGFKLTEGCTDTDGLVDGTTLGCEDAG